LASKQCYISQILNRQLIDCLVIREPSLLIRTGGPDNFAKIFQNLSKIA